MLHPDLLRLHGDDNIAIARATVEPGVEITDGLSANHRIISGHKVALEAVVKDAPIRKFGQIIGFANADIAAGDHIHVHNCAMGDFERDYAFGQDMRAVTKVPDSERRTFMGYRRENGRAGTRNYIAIVSTVNCSATVCKYIADAFNRSDRLKDFPNVDGVISFTHGTGCGLPGNGKGFDNLERVIWGHMNHPNVAAVLIIGLGCEVFQVAAFSKKYGFGDTSCIHRMTIQESGGTRATVEAGVKRIEEMLPLVNEIKREPVTADHLTLALQCGGSDGHSGVSANPALGHAADLLVAQGGTAILAETPEIYGAEHLLTRRAVSKQVGEKLIARIKWWEDYTKSNGAEMNNNPSPGNKAGGLTTILEKSLGAAAKGGTTPLVDVLHYAERHEKHGFLFMDSPGYDPASVTGQVAAGATLVCFTTGRGSAFGCKPSPSLKLATNSRMYNALTEDMDINCGEIVDGTRTVEEKGHEIFEMLLKVASGEQTKSEALGLGDNEFVPWHVGAIM